jgi:hypothetical protein
LYTLYWGITLPSYCAEFLHLCKLQPTKSHNMLHFFGACGKESSLIDGTSDTRQLDGQVAHAFSIVRLGERNQYFTNTL